MYFSHFKYLWLTLTRNRQNPSEHSSHNNECWNQFVFYSTIAIKEFFFFYLKFWHLNHHKWFQHLNNLGGIFFFWFSDTFSNSIFYSGYLHNFFDFFSLDYNGLEFCWYVLQKFLLFVNDLLQWPLWPSWTVWICCFKCSPRKMIYHMSHICDLCGPSCIALMCFLKSPVIENDYIHKIHNIYKCICVIGSPLWTACQNIFEQALKSQLSNFNLLHKKK